MKNMLLDGARRFGPYLVLALITAGVCFGVEPEPRNDSHYYRMAIAGFSVLLVVAYSVASMVVGSAREQALAAVRASMVVAAVGGWFNYYQFSGKVWNGLGDSVDITYYYVNSKYMAELNYFSLYPAMLLADKEGANYHSSKISQYRDLRDYKVKSVKVAYEHAAEIKQNDFTPERWEAFKHDVKFFLDPNMKSTRTMKHNFYVDHGYNPPPTWIVPGSALANLVPVENIKSIARVDIALVAAMFVGVAWAFGFDTMLFAMLFWVSTFSGRWPILGEALLRFDWVSALVLAMCFLKKEKWALAGGFLAYAGLNRIFPMIFFFGWGVVALLDTLKHKRLLPEHVRFIGGAALVSVVLIGMAMIQFGPSTFKDSANNLLMHNKSYSSHRVGLGDLILFRGEKTRAEMAKTEYHHAEGRTTCIDPITSKKVRCDKGIAAKEYKIQNMQAGLRLAALGALIFLALYIRRTGRRDAWAFTALAILPFYCATNPQINYYNLRIVVIVWHGFMVATTDRNALFHRVALALLFAGEFATQSAFLTKVPGTDRLAERYYVTSTTSLWLGIYFTWLIGNLVKEGWLSPPSDDGKVPAPAA